MSVAHERATRATGGGTLIVLDPEGTNPLDLGRTRNMYQQQNLTAKSDDKGAEPSGWLSRLLPLLSIFTMALTVPQVWAIWIDGNTGGVSLLSWGAYFVSACLWFVDGLRKGDKTIWVACIGWVILDGAVFIGVLVRH